MITCLWFVPGWPQLSAQTTSYIIIFWSLWHVTFVHVCEVTVLKYSLPRWPQYISSSWDYMIRYSIYLLFSLWCSNTSITDKDKRDWNSKRQAHLKNHRGVVFFSESEKCNETWVLSSPLYIESHSTKQPGY